MQRDYNPIVGKCIKTKVLSKQSSFDPGQQQWLIQWHEFGVGLHCLFDQWQMMQGIFGEAILQKYFFQ